MKSLDEEGNCFCPSEAFVCRDKDKYILNNDDWVSVENRIHDLPIRRQEF
jgi:hypothetical protein